MSASTPSTGPWPQAPLRSTFWPAAWLTILLALAKVTYVGMATFWTWATLPQDYVSPTFLQWAAAASQADTLFGVTVGGVAAVVLWWSRDRPRLARALGGAFVALALLLLLYAAVSRSS